MIFIPGEVPSSKNSKEIIFVNKKPRLVHSKATTKYIKTRSILYKTNKKVFDALVKGKKFPIHVRFTFTRVTKRQFDYINAAQIVQDLMVKYEWIPDDSCNYLVPHFGIRKIDKKNPGVKIEVI